MFLRLVSAALPTHKRATFACCRFLRRTSDSWRAPWGRCTSDPWRRGARKTGRFGEGVTGGLSSNHRCRPVVDYLQSKQAAFRASSNMSHGVCFCQLPHLHPCRAPNHSTNPRGSRYGASTELGLKSHVRYGFWGLIP